MKSQLGIIGMSVMGANLAQNFANKGLVVSVYNRTLAKALAVVDQDPTNNLVLSTTLADLCRSLERPRKVLLMIKAGDPVFEMVQQLTLHLQEGDIIIDGGNSFFQDTRDRVNYCKDFGIHYVGCGISGGEEGALKGPAMMVGCDPDIKDEILPLLDKVAATSLDGKTCCRYSGPDGAGHFVKMVHNGIEYADMQVISELYGLLKEVYGLDRTKIIEVFKGLNQGLLTSYLLDISLDILEAQDDLAKGWLLDQTLDVTLQKGTGLWTNVEALGLGVDTSVLLEGLNVRHLSMMKEVRQEASKLYNTEKKVLPFSLKDQEAVADALLFARLIAYSQAFDLFRRAEKTYGWSLNLADICLGWRAGCIIRSALLDDLAKALKQDPHAKHLLLISSVANRVKASRPSLVDLVVKAHQVGYGLPCLSASLTYLESLGQGRSPANLLALQRDYFGAHGYQRVDQPGFFHYDWLAKKSNLSE